MAADGQYVGIAVAVVGVALAVAGFAGFGGTGVGVLGILGLVVGGIVAVTGARAAAGELSYAKQERASLDTAVRRAVAEHRAAQQHDAAQRDRVDAELAALSEALG